MNVISTHNDQEYEVSITIEESALQGTLKIPIDAKGIVVFAHGSGSSRHSPRNRYVAKILHQRKLATLLMDLLTPIEETLDQQTHSLRFDIELLAQRLIGATDWLLKNPMTKPFKIGYFGASTGAGAALVAAAKRPKIVRAIVSRGGRPDLAAHALPYVQAPTLLIVGGNDRITLSLNQQAMAFLKVEKQLEIVPEATHLFEETGALEVVANLASHWFERHFTNSD